MHWVTMKINNITSPSFGWNIKTHLIETEQALENNKLLSENYMLQHLPKKALKLK